MDTPVLSRQNMFRSKRLQSPLPIQSLPGKLRLALSAQTAQARILCYLFQSHLSSLSYLYQTLSTMTSSSHGPSRDAPHLGPVLVTLIFVVRHDVILLVIVCIHVEFAVSAGRIAGGVQRFRKLVFWVVVIRVVLICSSRART
jgi:hypothetical protein